MSQTSEVVDKAVARVREMLGPAWEPVASRVKDQLSSQALIAAEVRGNPERAYEPEYQAARQRHVDALAGNINFYQPISLDLAQRAALAAWDALEAATETKDRP